MKKKLLIAAGVITAIAVGLLLSFSVGKEIHPLQPETTQSTAPAEEEKKVGDTITFGSYEQDNDLRNGKEPIEWLILADDGSRYTLLALNGLDAVAFSLESVDTTWETSYVREWLNDSFYANAFSAEERKAIVEMSLENTKNPTFGTQGGNATKDNVYLLSIDEYNALLLDTGNAPCSPTDYAVEQGVKLSDRRLCSWWLRTPGDSPIRAAAFYNTNEAFYGATVTTLTNAVRPVITVKY